MQEEILSIAGKIFSAANTDVSRKLQKFLKDRDYVSLVSTKVVPKDYTDSYAYYLDCFCTSFLSKYQDFPGSEKARNAEALNKWYAAEKQCFKANLRFSAMCWDYSLFMAEPPQIRNFLTCVKKHVSRCLGKMPESVTGRHGPGTTIQHRMGSTALDKFSTVPEATFEAGGWVQDWTGTLWCDSVSEGKNLPFIVPTVRADRLSFVPKKATESRCISVGPTLNVYYQLGVGGSIRSRLNQFGLLLEESQDIHRSLARSGSLKGHLSTIDLRSASDTLSYYVIKYLLPLDWFARLDSLRTKFTTVDKRTLRLEKFSAMGNGYTFELETLVFSSVCRAVAEIAGVTLNADNFSVYGDDIIIPVEISKSVIGALKYLGFSINLEKSFLRGPFRESCGGDFFEGVPVRGVYLKKEPLEAFDWMQLANQLRPHCQRFPGMSSIWGSVVQQIPLCSRCFGPTSLGSVVIHTEDQSRWQIRTRNSIRSVKVLRPIPFGYSIERWGPWSRLAAILSSSIVPPDNIEGEFTVSIRGRVEGYKIAWSPFS